MLTVVTEKWKIFHVAGMRIFHVTIEGYITTLGQHSDV